MSDITFDDLFVHVHKQAKTMFLRMHDQFLQTAATLNWAAAMEQHAERLMVSERELEILDAVERALAADPGDSRQDLVSHRCARHLSDVWALSGATCPFFNLSRESYRVAAANLLRDLELTLTAVPK